MICHHCHQQLPDDFTICPYCGTSQVNPDYVKVQSKKVAKGYSWAVTLVLFIITIVIAFVIQENLYLVDQWRAQFYFNVNETKILKRLDHDIAINDVIDYSGYIINHDLYFYDTEYESYYRIYNAADDFARTQTALSAIKEGKQNEYMDYYAEFAQALLDFNYLYEQGKRDSDQSLSANLDHLNESLITYITNVLGCSYDDAKELVDANDMNQVLQRLNQMIEMEG